MITLLQRLQDESSKNKPLPSVMGPLMDNTFYDRRQDILTHELDTDAVLDKWTALQWAPEVGST